MMLEDIESEFNIKVLFAIESGSRVWRLDSANSDYDVRFVYTRPIEDYLGLNTKEDVVTAHFDKMGIRMTQEGCYYDIAGFDIYKFVRMLGKSNPTCVEWLMSDMIYTGEQPKELKEWIEANFNPVSLFFHYQSMCKQNYEKYLKSKNMVTYKKYLYAMRGLVNAKYMEQFNKIPPIDFGETLKVTKLPHDVVDKLHEIIRLKREAKEKDIIQNIKNFDTYIELFLREREKPELIDKVKPHDTTPLNQYLLDEVLFSLNVMELAVMKTKRNDK